MLPYYRLKTIKQKHLEFSCIIFWSQFDSQIKQISIIGKTIHNRYITYDMSPDVGWDNQVTYFDIKNHKIIDEEKFDFLKTYIFLKNNNIPDKIIKSFMNRINKYQNRK